MLIICICGMGICIKWFKIVYILNQFNYIMIIIFLDKLSYIIILFLYGVIFILDIILSFFQVISNVKVFY